VLRATRVRWAIGAAALVTLAWQGHRLAHWLPQLEQLIESLGPWGPAVFMVALVLLEPLLVPDTIFGLAAGAVFGLAAGAAYYFAASYVMCLVTQWLGGRWLKPGITRLLERRPQLAGLVRAAPEGGLRFTFLVRLLPINQATLSYALGAVGVPLRNAVVGNLAMYTHMLPTVYFGAAAVHMTRMAATGHRHWERDGVLLMAGLTVCVLVAMRVTRRAVSALADPAERMAPLPPG
jgi:uncharacterized membrane protein YdjX (TVP38/TMEM64 family)